MTMTTPVTDDVSRYLADVAVHLEGLAPDERTELLDDLEQHLLEVAAEPGPPLHERLGPPADYAAELLASVGATDVHPTMPGIIGRAMARWHRVQASDRAAAARVFARDLRPAWWVLRGIIAGWALAALLSGSSLTLGWLVFPSVHGNDFLGAVLAAAGVSASIKLARRQAWPRLLLLANVGLCVYGLFLVSNAAGRLHQQQVVYYDNTQQPSQCLVNRDGRVIENLYPYDSEGHALDHVLLYDQSGHPLDNLCPAEFTEDASPVHTEYDRDANGAVVVNSFPRRQSKGQPGVVTYSGKDMPSTTTTSIPPPAIVTPRLTTTTTTTTTPVG
jgi:hypothetical protein